MKRKVLKVKQAKCTKLILSYLIAFHVHTRMRLRNHTPSREKTKEPEAFITQTGIKIKQPRTDSLFNLARKVT